jgi:hypothetical protein
MQDMDSRLKDNTLSQSQKDLYNSIKAKSKAILDSLQAEKDAPEKVINGTTDEEFVPSSDSTLNAE